MLVKARYGWSDKSFTSLLEVVHNLLAEDNTLPKSYYKAKKILCPMGMECQKIHACPNDCILYRHEFQQMSKCPVCRVYLFAYMFYIYECVKQLFLRRVLFGFYSH